MLKRLKKIFIICLSLFLGLLVVAAIALAFLYNTADMKQPEIDIKLPDQPLVLTDSCRQLGDNWLRHSPSGLWELKVSGADYQRGAAIGKLSQDLLYYQEDVFVNQIRQIIPSDSYLKFLRFFTVIFNRHLGQNVPEEYRREIYGISQYCTHEFDAIGTPYERQLNYHAAHDIGHTMQQYMLVGCSSFAAWGAASTDSALIVGRNFDFYVGDDFARNKEVQFYEPDAGYRFVSVAWPGMVGVLSGMNEKGLTVSINAARSGMPLSAATPISILVREILQYAANIDEAYDIAQRRKTFVAESILVGSAADGRAVIIEKSPHKIDRFATDSNYIVCTNHYQSAAFKNDKANIKNINTTDSEYRLKRLTQLIRQNTPIDAPKAAAMLRNYKGMDDGSIGLGNEKAINQFIAHHSVIFKPAQLMLWVSTSPWQEGQYVAYDLNKVFSIDNPATQTVNSPAYTIAADTAFLNHAYHKLMTYRSMSPQIKAATKAQTVVEDSVLMAFEQSNPDYYHTYELLGNYYRALGQPDKAVQCWSQALTKEIPRLDERKAIEKKQRKLTEKLHR